MSSEGNKINYGTSFQPTETSLCANGCGFFGSASTMNLCSKCFRDLRNQEEKAASALAAMEKLVMPNKQSSAADGVVSVGHAVAEAVAPVAESKVEQAAANRCRSCRKKVGVVGFKCRCGSTFCGTHRYPEHHDCEFDFKSAGREKIAKANPVVKADKIDHRI